ncbi:MAG TPA: hypothetical protein VGZ26_09900 [Pirellulales bacterium]|jgi:hypothetical protein|nr:hypothetical protein [Pirellulales bacterium]
MRRAIFALLAVTAVASSTGCCCIDRLFCGGCRGGCGYGYGNEGPCQSCGYGGGGGGCSDCGQYGGSSGGPQGQAPMQGMARRRPAQGHPMVQQRRDADGDYEFAAGPPTGSTTYPYYTNRGPRDFLARNPQSIGP